MKDVDGLDILAEQINEEREIDETPVEDNEESLDTGETGELLPADEGDLGEDHSGEENLAGEEQPVDDELQEAIARAKQKELAADARFQEAARLQKEVEQRTAYLEQLEAQLAEQRQKVIDESAGNVSEKFSTALLADEEKAGEMFAQTLARQKALEEKLAEVDGTLQQVNRVTEMQVRNQGAEFNRYYQKEYNDISGNDMLHKIAMEKASEIRSANPNLSEFEIIDKSAKEVRAFVKELSGDKITDKKRKMQKQPVKAGGRTRGKPALTPETRDDVLAQMQAAKAFS